MMNQKTLSGGIVAAGLLVLGVSYYVAQESKEIRLTLELKLSEQETVLANLAEVVDRNGADEVISKIIRNCAENSQLRFDTLLNSLANLRGAELVEVEQLYEACGASFAERKSVMVARLVREVSVYKDYIELYDTFDDRADVSTYPLALWQQLAELETDQAALMQTQVDLQGQIIDALQEGVLASGEEITIKLTRAQEIKETFAVNNIRIDEIRVRLSEL